MEENLHGEVDFDFFDSPKVPESSKKPPSGRHSDRKRADSPPRSRHDSNSDRSSVRKIEARVPKVVDKRSDSSDSDSEGNHPKRSYSEYKKSKREKARRGSGTDTSLTTTEIDSNTGKMIGRRNAWSDSDEDKDRKSKTKSDKHSDENRSKRSKRKDDKTRERSRSRSDSDHKKRSSRKKYSDESDTTESTSSGSSRSGERSRRRRRSHSKSQSRSRSRSKSRSRSRSRSRSHSSSTSDSSTSTSVSSSSDNEITDVSPLPSPDISPKGSPPRMYKKDHKRHKSSGSKEMYSPRHKDTVQYDSKGNAYDESKYARTNYRDELLRTSEDQMDLRSLLQAVLEMDKKEQKQNSGPSGQRFVLVPVPSKGNRKNFSFTNDKVRQIDQENKRLLEKIMREKSATAAAKKKKTPAKIAVDPPVRRVTHATVNRQREQRRIELENLEILKRLQNVGPTQGMSRTEQLDEYKRQMLLGVPTYGLDLHQPGYIPQTNYATRRTRPSSATKRPSNPYTASAALGKKSQSLTSLRSASGSSGKRNSLVNGKTRPQSAKQMLSSRPDWEAGW